MFVYIAAQFIGGVMGYALLRSVTPGEMFYSNGSANGLCVTVPGAGVPPMQALLVEFIITFILILVRILFLELFGVLISHYSILLSP